MARRGRKLAPLELREGEREALERFVKRSRTNRDLGLRSRMILGLVAGKSQKEVADELHVIPQTVGKWRKRFSEGRLEGLLDEPRPGAPRKIQDDKIEAVVVATLESLPEGSTHWSTRTMAKKAGLSQSAVNRIWRAFGLKPHLTDTFVLSKDPLLVEKVRDIVGLYMNPPMNALVLCVDEKSQIQALNRSQPIIPMTIGQVELKTNDYIRHGTTTLFAALDIATGNVLGKCFARHRSVEFLKFLDHIERNVPKELDIHLVLDNYGTPKTQIIKDWLLKRPRYKLHFTPTHGSWINQVERWFGLLTERAIKRNAHLSVTQLQKDIKAFIEVHNKDPKPFTWVKDADQILDSIARFADRTLKLAQPEKMPTNTVTNQ